MRAADLLKAPSSWAIPAIVGSVLIGLITVLYIGSAVDPVGQMSGLPVSLVDRDAGARAGGREVELGRRVAAALSGAPQVTEKLAIEQSGLGAARRRMDRGDAYATVVIPPGFSARALALRGGPPPAGAAGLPTIVLLSNLRAGTEGASLATGVLGPALSAISPRSLQRQVTYRPLSEHAALGLSPFYVSLLILMVGFLSAAIINGVLDGALGFAPTEIGPRWSQRRPVLISRWQTLLAKWGVAVGITALLLAVVLLVAVGLLGLDAPQPLLLWLFGWLCAITVAVGTLSLIAVLGSQGQVVALLIFVYLGLASAGATVPVEALPEPLALLSHADPLRQILKGVRAILFFEARGDAGLTQGLVATVIGLIVWLGFGAYFVRRYDRQGLDRFDRAELERIERAAAS